METKFQKIHPHLPCCQPPFLHYLPGMKSFIRHLLLVAALLSFAGCQTTGPESMPPSVKDDAYEFFGHTNVELFWVPSSGSFADSSFNTISKTAPSQMAMDLSRIMAKGGLRQVDIAIAGPNSAKVRRVIKDAFAEQVTRLPKLYILYIGEPLELEELEKTAIELNVHFRVKATSPGELGGKVKKTKEAKE
jgi:hypothetical protein